MKRTKAVSILALLSLIAISSDASAERIRARLRGFSEVPAVSSTARGDFTAKVSADQIEYELRYSDLEGATTLFAHIHLGQTDVNGGVCVFLCGGGGKPDCPATSGTVTGTIVFTDVIGPAGQGIDVGELEEVIAAIRAGKTYVNVHTDKHPGGEIRGQVRGGGDQ